MSAARDLIFGSRDGILRVGSVFAGALLIWSVVMVLSVAPYPKRSDVPNFDGPILSIELAKDDAALHRALGVDPPLESWVQARIHRIVEINTELDFVYIFCYTAFLLSFTCAIFPGEKKSVLRWVCRFIFLAAVADCLENIGIFHALYDRDATAAAISIPSHVKWLLLNLIIALDGALLLRGKTELCIKRIERLLGLILVIAGITGIAGLASGHHEWLQYGMLLFALAPIATLGLQAVRPEVAVASPVVEKDGAMAEEFQYLYGPLVITNAALFLGWLSSGAPLAKDILAMLGISTAPRLETFDDALRGKVEQGLGELADSTDVLSKFYDNGREPAGAEGGKSNPDPTPRAAPRLLRTLQTMLGVPVETEAHSRDIRQLNILFLKGENRGLTLRGFDSAPGAHVNHSALCLSGGGIRSATFNLGILQGLSRFGILDHFSYLSTVSGGGFAGGWLSALKLRTQDKGELQINGEVRAVEHLRDYSNYLSPEVGLLSADTWSLIAIYLRNLLLTWIVIIPCMAAALMTPRLIRSYYTATPGVGVQYLLIAVGFIALILGVGYIGAHLPSHELNNTDELRRLRNHTRISAVAAFLAADLFFSFEYAVEFLALIPAITMELLLVVPLFMDFKRPEGQEEPASNGQTEFLARGLVPLLVSAVTLSGCWKWISPASSLRYPPSFLLGGTIAVLLPWAVCTIYARANKIAQLRDDKISADSLDDFDFQRGLSMLMLFIAALLGSGAGWIIATRNWVPYKEGLYVCFAAPILIGIFLLAGTLMAGSISRRTRDDDEEWWARAGAWLLIAACVWVVSTVCVLYLPSMSLAFAQKVYAKWTSSSPLNWTDILTGAAGLAGALSALGSLIAGFSGKTPGSNESGPEVSEVLSTFASVGAGVGLIYIVVILGLLTDSLLGALARRFAVTPMNPYLLIVVLASFAGASGLAGIVINTNKFSLHYYWRNRIVRAYLGASNPKPARFDPFIGFSTDDNLQMWELRKIKDHRPFHVLNTALNLTGTRDLAWQERKAESFTISPLHCGCYSLGYRDSRYYGRINYSGKEGISLGAAMALSGAAVSPNMGYMVSSPVLRFLMTLFNLRLGAWLGNPGKYGEQTFRMGAPGHSIGPIVREALGLINQGSPWVYLSDGGHFENLGLYEMVRRRCQFVLVGDASTDTNYDFESLAMAVRKIRIDFNASVEILKVASIGRSIDGKGSYYALGTIQYSGGLEGKLIYIKASMTGSEPEDVRNYQRTRKDFPQESIADQFFTESQFESYRALGDHIIETMFEGVTFTGLSSWFDHLKAAGQSAGDDTNSKLVAALRKAVSAAS